MTKENIKADILTKDLQRTWLDTEIRYQKRGPEQRKNVIKTAVFYNTSIMGH